MTNLVPNPSPFAREDELVATRFSEAEMARFRDRGNTVPDFKESETLVGQPAFENQTKTVGTPNSPYPWNDFAADLLNDLLVARRNWEVNPDDPFLWKTFIEIQGEVRGRLIRDMEVNGNELLVRRDSERNEL